MISTAYYFGRTPTYTSIGPLWLWFVGFKQACKRRFHGRILGPAPVDQEAVTPRWPGSREAPDTLRTGHPWWHKGVLDTAGEEAPESPRTPKDEYSWPGELDVPVDYEPRTEIPPPPSMPSRLGYPTPGPFTPNYWAVLCLALTLALAWSVLGGGP